MNGMNLMVEMVFGLTDNSLYYCNMEILQGNRRKELGGLDADFHYENNNLQEYAENPSKSR